MSSQRKGSSEGLANKDSRAFTGGKESSAVLLLLKSAFGRLCFSEASTGTSAIGTPEAGLWIIASHSKVFLPFLVVALCFGVWLQTTVSCCGGTCEVNSGRPCGHSKEAQEHQQGGQ